MSTNEALVPPSSSRPVSEPLRSGPLTPVEIDALARANGELVDEKVPGHSMFHDLEMRGHLRRIRSFNPKHYRRGDGPKYVWTRTVIGEMVVGRMS